jgi:hypothetical protein
LSQLNGGDVTIYLNSVGKALSGRAQFDEDSGLVVVADVHNRNKRTFVRCEQIAALNDDVSPAFVSGADSIDRGRHRMPMERIIRQCA